MKKGLFIICAIALVLGITSGALAGASAKQTSRFCVYIDKTAIAGEIRTSTLLLTPKYGHKTYISRRAGCEGS